MGTPYWHMEEFRLELAELTVVKAARRLLGCEVVGPDCRFRIVEAEAYGGSNDLGSHGCRGVTKRNAPMFGRAGHAYVYFTYGNHWMLNVTCGHEGECAAVLLRGGLPLEGIEAMWGRRPKSRTERDLLSGPGKIATAVGIDGQFSGQDMLSSRAKFRLVPGKRVGRVLVTTRVGLAPGQGDDKKWRFIEAANLEWASKPWPK